eukprot:jgi/Botrbrau1/19165/Bobra.0077s0075.1
MGDIKDILGIPKNQLVEAPKATKDVKPQRPHGMSREAFALLGSGAVPIVPGIAVDHRKRKADPSWKEKRKQAPKGDKYVYRFLPFKNEARADGLQLLHWVKCIVDPSGQARPKDGDSYHAAKLNHKAEVLRYDDEEFKNVIRNDPDWTRKETDYLLDLCELYGLRFTVITDRYNFPGGKPRSMEDIKARYYAIARQLVVAREGGEEAAVHLTLIKQPYNADHERDRKAGIHKLMTRTPQQLEEERVIVEKAKKIEDARRVELAQRPVPQSTRSPSVDVPTTNEFQEPLPAGTSSLFDAQVEPCKPRTPGVYLRSKNTLEVAAQQNAQIPGGARQAKLVDTWLAENNGHAPIMFQRATCGAWLTLRKEVIALVDFKRRLNLGAGGSVPPGGVAKRPSKSKARYEEPAIETPKYDKRPRTAKKFADE